MKLSDVPFKHARKCLAVALNVGIERICNIPDTAKSVHELFMWAVGHGPEWKLPLRLMPVQEFIELYTKMYHENGDRLRDLDLDSCASNMSSCLCFVESLFEQKDMVLCF
eukprot:984094-Lingulodinium_polyedra.AAC.1